MAHADFFTTPDEMLAKRAAAVRKLLPEHLFAAAGFVMPTDGPGPEAGEDGQDGKDGKDESDGEAAADPRTAGAWLTVLVRRPSKKTAAEDPLRLRRAADA